MAKRDRQVEYNELPAFLEAFVATKKLRQRTATRIWNILVEILVDHVTRLSYRSRKDIGLSRNKIVAVSAGEFFRERNAGEKTTDLFEEFRAKLKKETS